jgi:hypothetical protein
MSAPKSCCRCPPFGNCDVIRRGQVERIVHATRMDWERTALAIKSGKPAQLTTASPGRQPCGCVSTVAKCRVGVTTSGKPAQLTTASPGRQPCGCVSAVAKCRVSVTTIGKPAQLTTASPGRQPCGCVSAVAKCRVSVTTSGKPAQLTLWARRVGRYAIRLRHLRSSLRSIPPCLRLMAPLTCPPPAT